MTDETRTDATVDRRGFLKTAGAGLTAATAMLTSREQAMAQAASEKARLDRLASCTWPIRQIFKTRAGGGRGPGQRRRWSRAGGRRWTPGRAPERASPPAGTR